MAAPDLNPQQIRHRAEKLIHKLQPAVDWDERAAALQDLITIVQTGVLKPALPEILRQMKEPLRDQVQDRYIRLIHSLSNRNRKKQKPTCFTRDSS